MTTINHELYEVLLNLKQLIDEILREEGATPNARYGKTHATMSNKALLAEITARIDDSGISTSSLAYKYLQDAALLARQMPKLLTSMTKTLYPMIAEINSTSRACVERNIRSAIYRAHKRGLIATYGRRPTNAEFIRYLSRQIDPE